MENRIREAYNATSKALNNIYIKRKRTLRYQRIIWVIAGAFFIWMTISLLIPNAQYLKLNIFKNFNPSGGSPYAGIFPLVALMALLYPANYAFVKAFQNFKTLEHNTIAQMVHKLFPTATFTQGIAPPRNEVKASKLFPGIQENTQLYAYGLLRQTIHKNTIHITDIGLVESKATSYAREGLSRIPLLNMLVVMYHYVFKNIFTSQTADSVQLTFRGMFAWMSFKKSLNGHTVILTKNQSTKINRFLSNAFKEEERIYLEDLRFTEKFIVYSTDQVEARYVLSTILMERISSLQEKFNQPIMLSFKDKQTFLAVANNDGLFSFPMVKLDSLRVVEKLAASIETALRIQEDF